jgi:dipeptidyl aminopeptidase/acylaminoacyl peptidase
MKVGMLIFGATLSCCQNLAGEARAQTTSPLAIEAALAQPEFPSYFPLAFSPDGKWVAYTLKYPNRNHGSRGSGGYSVTGMSEIMAGSRVWITEVKSGHTISVGSDSATSALPVFSPDGKWLAFYCDADGRSRVWVREMSTGKERRVSDAIVRASQGLQGPRWTPDSRKVVAPILPYGSEVPEIEAARRRVASAVEHATADTIPSVTVLHADPERVHGGEGTEVTDLNDPRQLLLADLALQDVATGSVATLVRRAWPTHYVVSPDGKQLLVSSKRAPRLTPRWAEMYDLLMVPLRTSADSARTIVWDAAVNDFGRSFAWSPDAGTLLYSVADSAARQQIFALDVASGDQRRVANSSVAGISAFTEPGGFRSLTWDPSGHGFYALEKGALAVVSMPDGIVRALFSPPANRILSSIVAPTRSIWNSDQPIYVEFWNDSAKRSGFAAVRIGQPRWTILREENKSYGSRTAVPITVSSNGGALFLSEDAQHPRELWVAAPDLSEARQLTQSASLIEGHLLGESRLIEWRTPTGAPRRGTLLLPAEYVPGRRYPLVVYPYPTEFRSNDVNVFGVTGTGTENMQLLATRGFAVLAPDMPPFDWKNQMREIPPIINSGIDRVIELGIADSARLGIIGHSWGGYAVIATIAQSPRFRAAVARGGLADQVAGYGILNQSGYAFGAILEDTFFGGSIWDVPDRYIANSPIWLLDKVKTPLLIIHGEAETTVPIFLANQVFASLQRLGKEVEFARYAGENHNEALWTYANQRDYLRRMIGWFETHLQTPGKP